MDKTLRNILIISFVLTIIIIGVLVLFFHKNKAKTDNTDDSNNNPQEIIIKETEYGSFTDESQLKGFLVYVFNSFSECSSGELFDFTNKDKITYDDLSEENINNIIYNYLSNLLLVSSTNKKVTEEYEIERLANEDLNIKISTELIKEAVSYLFGEEAANKYILKETFKISDTSILTLEDNYYVGTVKINYCTDNKYKGFYPYESFLDNDKYIIKNALYWSKLVIEEKDGERYGYSYVYADENSNDYICQLKDIINSLDSLIKYQMVFKKENKHFIFDYIEQVS